MVQSLPKAAAPHFRALHTAVGLPRRRFCSCAAASPRPESGGAQGLPRRALVCAAPRAWLPLRAWLFPLGRELLQRDPGTTKDKRVQPATAAAHTTHLT